MADPEKGNSAADSKKKSAMLDDDFGKDFLSFWGPSKKGNDKMDFDMEEVPRNKKKSFNFDKLDDFELGGDFDKLPSFKMDMPDLDFCTPDTKDDKPNEKPTGKQESKRDKFSFNFDFNGLDRFDLSSSPVKGEKKLSNHANSNTSDCSYKHVRNMDFRSSSNTSSDAFRDKSLNTGSKATSRPPESLIAIGDTKDSKDPKPFISYSLEQNNASHEVQTPIDKQNSVIEENKDETHSNECHNRQPEETFFTGTNTEKTTQDFILQSVSGNCSGQENNPKCLGGPASLDAVKAVSNMEIDGRTRSVDSSQSRNSNHVNSYNKEDCSETSKKTSAFEVPNTGSDLQKQNQNDVTGGNEVISESGHGQGQTSFQDASFTDFSQNMTSRVKSTGDKQNLGSKFIPCRDSGHVNPKSLNEKVAESLQLNSLSKSKNNGSPKASFATKKKLDFADANKFRTLSMQTMKENRKSKQNYEQAEIGKVGISKSNADGSVLQPNISNLQNQTTANSSLLGHNVVPSIPSIKCSKALPVEKSRLMNVIYVPKSATTKEAKLMGLSESSLKFSLNMSSKMESMSSKMESTALTENSGPLNSCLKRKTLEECTADSENLKPLKRVMESVIGREPFEVSQKSQKTVDPVTENMGTAHRHRNAKALASNDILKLQSVTDIEVPMLIENDGRAEKTKELVDAYPSKQIIVAEENKKEIYGSEEQGDQSKGTCLTKAEYVIILLGNFVKTSISL